MLLITGSDDAVKTAALLHFAVTTKKEKEKKKRFQITREVRLCFKKEKKREILFLIVMNEEMCRALCKQMCNDFH